MEKSGWLTKTNKRNKKQQRFYVLDRNTKTLTYFKKPLGEPLGVIDLNTSEIKDLKDSTFYILTTVSKVPKKFMISASNANDASEWFEEIKSVIENKEENNKGEKIGWMMKKGKNRWFLLKNGILYWFTKEQPPSSDFRKFIKGSIQLDGCTCSPVSTKNLMIGTNTKSYTLMCVDAQERDSWVDAIRLQFNSIKQETNNSLQKSGWLEKKGQRRFFILKDNVMKWYTSDTDTGSERGSLMISEYMVTNVNETGPQHFSLVSTSDPSKRYRLSAKNKQEADEWVLSLKKSMKSIMENKRKSTISLRQSTVTTNRVSTSLFGNDKRKSINNKNNNNNNNNNNYISENSTEEKTDLIKKGWLLKKGKSRFFILKNEVMMYFVSDDPNNSVINMKGSLNLIGCIVTQEHYSFTIKTKRGILYKLTATSQPEVMEWIEYIREAAKGKGEEEMSSIAGTLVPLKKTGWVSKKGKRRFLLLRTGDLLYFENEQNGEVFTERPKGVILLSGCTVNDVGSNSFLVRSADDNSWVFICNNQNEAKDWIDHLSVFIVRANDALASGLEKSGYLTKKGQQRWFALKKGVLLWYNTVQQPDFISTDTANGNLTLFGCTVKQTTNKKYSFTITPPDTGKKVYELIAPSESEMNSWTSCLSNASKKNPISTSSNTSGEVFGQPLSKVLQHDKTDIPILVTKAIEFIESKGLDSPGIFRLSGDIEKVKEIKESYDKYKYIDFESVNASQDDITGLLKLYIRELPEPLTTYELYTPLLDKREDPEGIKQLISTLPKENYCFLKFLIIFLGKVISFEEVNHMSTSNIAIVVGPNLLRPKEANMLTSLADTPNILALTRTLIDKRDLIFV